MESRFGAADQSAICYLRSPCCPALLASMGHDIFGHRSEKDVFPSFPGEIPPETVEPLERPRGEESAAAAWK
ncbi:MAG: hypothetical protein CSB33_02200 [Desulfobacterales bacterium]|nr:MAG: hypothetical protein CSB33_02200 [Desulfobacterales bacterium]